MQNIQTPWQLTEYSVLVTFSQHPTFKPCLLNGGCTDSGLYFVFFLPPPPSPLPHPLFLLLRLINFLLLSHVISSWLFVYGTGTQLLKPQTCERCDLVASLCDKFQAHGDRGWPEILTLRFELKWIDLLTLHAVDKTIHPFIVCELLHCIHDQHS